MRDVRAVCSRYMMHGSVSRILEGHPLTGQDDESEQQGQRLHGTVRDNHVPLGCLQPPALAGKSGESVAEEFFTGWISIISVQSAAWPRSAKHAATSLPGARQAGRRRNRASTTGIFAWRRALDGFKAP